MTPIAWFRENIRPAQLMLSVYKLLDSGDTLLREGDLVEKLRQVVRAESGEDLLVIRNEIFLGLVREAADLPPSTFKTRALAHLLRQAVVASCTALDTYLPALLRCHLPAVIEVRKQEFLPHDPEIRDYFTGLKFSLQDVLRLLDREDAYLFITNRILNTTNFKYLSTKRGIHVTGGLLGLADTWEAVARHLGREKEELMRVLDAAVKRRNDIVHRADRSQKSPDGDQQEITFAQASQYVHTINDVCHALDELVKRRLAELGISHGEGA